MYVSVLNDPVGRPLSRCLLWTVLLSTAFLGASVSVVSSLVHHLKLQRACDAAFSGTSLESQIVLSSWYSFHPELVLKA